MVYEPRKYPDVTTKYPSYLEEDKFTLSFFLELFPKIRKVIEKSSSCESVDRIYCSLLESYLLDPFHFKSQFESELALYLADAFPNNQKLKPVTFLINLAILCLNPGKNCTSEEKEFFDEIWKCIYPCLEKERTQMEKDNKLLEFFDPFKEMENFTKKPVNKEFFKKFSYINSNLSSSLNHEKKNDENEELENLSSGQQVIHLITNNGTYIGEIGDSKWIKQSFKPRISLMAQLIGQLNDQTKSFISFYYKILSTVIFEPQKEKLISESLLYFKEVNGKLVFDKKLGKENDFFPFFSVKIPEEVKDLESYIEFLMSKNLDISVFLDFLKIWNQKKNFNEMSSLVLSKIFQFLIEKKEENWEGASFLCDWISQLQFQKFSKNDKEQNELIQKLIKKITSITKITIQKKLFLEDSNSLNRYSSFLLEISKITNDDSTSDKITAVRTSFFEKKISIFNKNGNEKISSKELKAWSEELGSFKSLGDNQREPLLRFKTKMYIELAHLALEVSEFEIFSEILKKITNIAGRINGKSEELSLFLKTHIPQATKKGALTLSKELYSLSLKYLEFEEEKDLLLFLQPVVDLLSTEKLLINSRKELYETLYLFDKKFKKESVNQIIDQIFKSKNNGKFIFKWIKERELETIPLLLKIIEFEGYSSEIFSELLNSINKLLPKLKDSSVEKELIILFHDLLLQDFSFNLKNSVINFFKLFLKNCPLDIKKLNKKQLIALEDLLKRFDFASENLKEQSDIETLFLALLEKYQEMRSDEVKLDKKELKILLFSLLDREKKIKNGKYDVLLKSYLSFVFSEEIFDQKDIALVDVSSINTLSKEHRMIIVDDLEKRKNYKKAFALLNATTLNATTQDVETVIQLIQLSELWLLSSIESKEAWKAYLNNLKLLKELSFSSKTVESKFSKILSKVIVEDKLEQALISQTEVLILIVDVIDFYASLSSNLSEDLKNSVLILMNHLKNQPKKVTEILDRIDKKLLSVSISMLIEVATEDNNYLTVVYKYFSNGTAIKDDLYLDQLSQMLLKGDIFSKKPYSEEEKNKFLKDLEEKKDFYQQFKGKTIIEKLKGKEITNGDALKQFLNFYIECWEIAFEKKDSLDLSADALQVTSLIKIFYEEMRIKNFSDLKENLLLASEKTLRSNGAKTFIYTLLVLYIDQQLLEKKNKDFEALLIFFENLYGQGTALALAHNYINSLPFLNYHLNVFKSITQTNNKFKNSLFLKYISAYTCLDKLTEINRKKYFGNLRNWIKSELELSVISQNTENFYEFIFFLIRKDNKEYREAAFDLFKELFLRISLTEEDLVSCSVDLKVLIGSTFKKFLKQERYNSLSDHIKVDFYFLQIHLFLTYFSVKQSKDDFFTKSWLKELLQPLNATADIIEKSYHPDTAILLGYWLELLKVSYICNKDSFFDESEYILGFMGALAQNESLDASIKTLEFLRMIKADEQQSLYLSIEMEMIKTDEHSGYPLYFSLLICATQNLLLSLFPVHKKYKEALFKLKQSITEIDEIIESCKNIEIEKIYKKEIKIFYLYIMLQKMDLEQSIEPQDYYIQDKKTDKEFLLRKKISIDLDYMTKVSSRFNKIEVNERNQEILLKLKDEELCIQQMMKKSLKNEEMQVANHELEDYLLRKLHKLIFEEKAKSNEVRLWLDQCELLSSNFKHDSEDYLTIVDFSLALIFRKCLDSGDNRHEQIAEEIVKFLLSNSTENHEIEGWIYILLKSPKLFTENRFHMALSLLQHIFISSGQKPQNIFNMSKFQSLDKLNMFLMQLQVTYENEKKEVWNDYVSHLYTLLYYIAQDFIIQARIDGSQTKQEKKMRECKVTQNKCLEFLKKLPMSIVVQEEKIATGNFTDTLEIPMNFNYLKLLYSIQSSYTSNFLKLHNLRSNDLNSLFEEKCVVNVIEFYSDIWKNFFNKTIKNNDDKNGQSILKDLERIKKMFNKN